MKKVLMMIVICFVVCGCTHFMGIMSNNNYYETLHLKATASMYNAELACYQLSGAVETKNFNVNDAKIWEIAQAKAQHNNTQQVEQCLKRLDEPKQKLKARCDNLNTENALTNLSAFNCFKEMDKVFTDFINEISPKTKNITFTCSQGDEVLAKFGPQFDADIATYALDTIQFKPLVSKELSQDVAKNIAQELDKNLFKDIDKKATAEFIKESSSYRIKDNMSLGKISKELVRVREEIKGQQNKYKAYSKQQRKEQNQKINKEIAELVIEKKKLEAMLKFIKEQ